MPLLGWAQGPVVPCPPRLLCNGPPDTQGLPVPATSFFCFSLSLTTSAAANIPTIHENNNQASLSVLVCNQEQWWSARKDTRGF